MSELLASLLCGSVWVTIQCNQKSLYHHVRIAGQSSPWLSVSHSTVWSEITVSSCQNCWPGFSVDLCELQYSVIRNHCIIVSEMLASLLCGSLWATVLCECKLLDHHARIADQTFLRFSVRVVQYLVTGNYYINMLVLVGQAFLCFSASHGVIRNYYYVRIACQTPLCSSVTYSIHVVNTITTFLYVLFCELVYS